MTDINDIFNNIFMAEEKFVKLGHVEGVKAGEKDTESHERGVNIGISKALEIANELGYYWGFAAVWSNHLIIHSVEHLKLISLLGEIRREVEEVVGAVDKVDIHNKLLLLRARHRQACVKLKVKNTGVKVAEKMDF